MVPTTSNKGSARRRRLEWVVYLTLLLACVLGAAWVLRVPGSGGTIRVKPPAQALAPRLAALSDVWEAVDGRPRTVVVEDINESWAMIINVGPQDRWERRLAHVLPDGTVRWGYPEQYALSWSEAGAVLERAVVVTAERIVLRRGETPRTVGPFLVETGPRLDTPPRPALAAK